MAANRTAAVRTASTEVSPEKKIPFEPDGIVIMMPGVRRIKRSTCPSILFFYIFFVAFHTDLWVTQ